MTMESVAGKNPITHVGKLYNVLARNIATVLVENVPGITHAQCALVSQIGRPIEQPQTVDVRVRTADECQLDDLATDIGSHIDGQLATVSTLWEPIIGGEVSLY